MAGKSNSAAHFDQRPDARRSFKRDAQASIHPAGLKANASSRVARIKSAGPKTGATKQPADANQLTAESSKPTPTCRRNASRGRATNNGRPVYLFGNWPRTAAWLRTANVIALFMDFDGTLAPLQSHPQRVWLSPKMRLALSRLAQHSIVHMWVVSGRLRADVQKRVNLAGIEHLGLHGWDRGDGASLSMKAFQSLRRARVEIRARLRCLPGVWIEDKAPIFAVHYREAPRAVIPQVAAAVRQVVDPLLSELRIMKGLKVWEVLPRDFKGKGATIAALMTGFPPDTLAIYLGDDATDESGFAALPKGLTVRVGMAARRPTAARFYLRDPDEVASFLERMEEAIR